MDLGGVGQGEKLSILQKLLRLQRSKNDRKRLGNFSVRESRPDMMDAILYKEDFLYAHKAEFAQIVWCYGRAKCTIHREKDGVATISGDNFGLLKVPSNCIHHAQPIISFKKKRVKTS
jgi:hypothetical protein